jgi:hypothetical protein
MRTIREYQVILKEQPSKQIMLDSVLDVNLLCNWLTKMELGTPEVFKHSYTLRSDGTKDSFITKQIR